MTREGISDPQFKPDYDQTAPESPDRSVAPSGSFIIIVAIVLLAIFILVPVIFSFLDTDIPAFPIKWLVGLALLGITFFVAIIFSLSDHRFKQNKTTQNDLKESSTTDIPICPNCLAPNKPQAHFCIKCTTPLTSHAAIDPLARIHSAGDTYRKASKRPANKAVLVGMWLIFGPQIPLLLSALIFSLGDLFTEGRNFFSEEGIFRRYTYYTLPLGSILTIVLTSGLLILYSAILLKTSKNYSNKRNLEENKIINP